MTSTSMPGDWTNTKSTILYDGYDTPSESETNERTSTGTSSKSSYESLRKNDSIFGSSTATAQKSTSNSDDELKDNELFSSRISHPQGSGYGSHDGVSQHNRRALSTSPSKRPQGRARTPNSTFSNSSTPISLSRHRRSQPETPTPVAKSLKFRDQDFHDSEQESASSSPSPHHISPRSRRLQFNTVESVPSISPRRGDSGLYYISSQNINSILNALTVSMDGSLVLNNSMDSGTTSPTEASRYMPPSSFSATAPTSPQPSNMINIDSNGDLKICFGSDKHEISMCFLVSSQVLISNSPKFYEEFASRSFSDTAIEFQKKRLQSKYKSPATIFMDNYGAYHPEAWALIFKILHDSDPLFSIKPKFEILVDIAAICEEYQLHKKLRDTGRVWCEQWKTKILEKGFENWIILAWTFGLENEFKAISNHLGTRVHENERNEECIWCRRSQGSTSIFASNDKTASLRVRGDADSIVELTHAVPTELAVHILKRREYLLEPIQRKFQKTLRDLRSTKFVRCKGELQNFARQCDWINLGFVSHTVHDRKLDDDETWRGGICEILEILSMIAKDFRNSEWKCKSNATLINPNPVSGSPPKRGRKSDMERIKTCSWAEELEYKLQKAISEPFELELCDFESRTEIFPELRR